MGSTGSGSFTDYSKRKASSEVENGGASGQDNCGKGFSTRLEDVSRCFYFMNKNDVPSIGSDVRVFFNGIRIAVETVKGEEIGYLPTKFNYIKSCLDDGFKYIGLVNIASRKPVPSVTVDILPK